MFNVISLKQDDPQWQAFYDLPDSIYQGDPNYIKPSLTAVKTSVNRPEFQGHQLPLIAVGGNQVLARMVVRRAQDLHGYAPDTIGLISFFEAKDNYPAVEALFHKAIAWLKDKKIHHLIGPMDGDTWHKYRFNVGPFDRPPFMMEPYNPPYYGTFWERFGFRVLAKYFSKHVNSKTVVPLMEKYYRRAEQNGFTFRSFHVKQFENELKILYDLSCQNFAGNYFYTPILLDDFCGLYVEAKAIIDKRLVWFCQDKEGEYCGFIFSFPDYFLALQSMHGQHGLVSKLKFVVNRRKAATLNIKTIGVTPRYRGRGLSQALMYKAYFEGSQMGLHQANLCLIHEENVSAKLDAGQGRITRNYHLYEYQF